MAEELLRSIEQLSRERGISPDIFYSAIEEALLTVADKYFDHKADIQVEINKEQGRINVYTKKSVVNEPSDSSEISWKEALKHDSKAKVGDEIKIFLPGETLGRVAAQTARNIIMDKVQKAEQHTIYSKYVNLTDTLISGDVRRIEKNGIIAALEIGEAIIPHKELSPKDEFNRGDIIRFYVKRVFSEGKGPLVLGSRYMNDFVRELVKKEVPEVSEGIVKIFGIAREPGVKTKVAVYSTDKSVDPVGAVVGMNGNRVLSITKELQGERIDVIAWNESVERFISSALTPAEVTKVKIIDEENKMAEVTVSESTLSAAIGKKGINIKLASRLTRWNLQLTNRMENFTKVTQKKL
ncbi:MAG: transcription termination factor NusA [Acidobacteriota bacterium]